MSTSSHDREPPLNQSKSQPFIKPTIETDTCFICRSEFSYDTEYPIALQCGHVFGSECIHDWFASGSTWCPICSANPLEFSTTGQQQLKGGIFAFKKRNQAPFQYVSMNPNVEHYPLLYELLDYVLTAPLVRGTYQRACFYGKKWAYHLTAYGITVAWLSMAIVLVMRLIVDAYGSAPLVWYVMKYVYYTVLAMVFFLSHMLLNALTLIGDWDIISYLVSVVEEAHEGFIRDIQSLRLF